jgi:protein-serine/threonine kinase
LNSRHYLLVKKSERTTRDYGTPQKSEISRKSATCSIRRNYYTRPKSTLSTWNNFFQHRSLDDWTALHWASNNGHFDAVKILIENGANLEAKTTFGRTPLHLCSMRGQIDIIKILLENKANVSSVDKEFNTPVHYACEHGYLEIVKILLDFMPDLTSKNNAGLTCIDVANNVEVRNLFEERDLINESTMSSFGRTSIGGTVIYNGRADFVGKLLMSNIKYDS